MERQPLSFQQVKVVRAFVLAAMLLDVWIAETYARSFDGHITLWHWAVVALGAWSAAGGGLVRRKLLDRATADGRDGKELVAARKWSTAQLLGLICAQGVLLCGVIAKMVLGCPRWFGAPFT